MGYTRHFVGEMGERRHRSTASRSCGSTASMTSAATIQPRSGSGRAARGRGQLHRPANSPMWLATENEVLGRLTSDHASAGIGAMLRGAKDIFSARSVAPILVTVPRPSLKL